jgi:hypothetical protein
MNIAFVDLERLVGGTAIYFEVTVPQLASAGTVDVAIETRMGYNVPLFEPPRLVRHQPNAVTF